MVEALTQGLSGFGRKDAPTRWGASVYLQLIDPQAFAGRDAFVAQTGFFADECRASPATDPSRPVRLPGTRPSGPSNDVARTACRFCEDGERLARMG